MKIKKLIICLLTITCMNTAVFAQIIAYPDPSGNSIIVSGTVSNDNVQIVLLKPGFDVSDAEDAVASDDKSKLQTVVEYFGQVTAADKHIEIKIPMRDDAVKEKYSLAADNTESSVYFATTDEKTTMVSAAKTALQNNTFATFSNGDGKYFCNSNLYESLSDPTKAAEYAADILKKLNDIDIASLSSAMNMGIFMEALNESKIDDLSTIKTMTNSSGMVVPIEKIDLVKNDKLGNVISNISGKNFASVEEYKKLLAKSIFINVIINADDMLAADLKTFFEDYAQAIELNLNSYNNLSSNKKTEAIAKLSKRNITPDTLQSILDEICKSIAGNNDSPAPTLSVRDSGSSIRVPMGSMGNNSSDTTENAAYGLSDLSECKWARPAIEYLVKSGIISGYDDNTFRPYKKTTRAEFISMISRKFLPNKSDGQQSFSDVKSDSWYFNYVENAYRNGIIYGIGNGVFAPNENISRQDMAVILYRLAEFTGHKIDGNAIKFADDANIADHAKSAIYSLRSVNIVNGDENGNFNPYAAATRAEVAQMLYNFIGFLN